MKKQNNTATTQVAVVHAATQTEETSLLPEKNKNNTTTTTENNENNNKENENSQRHPQHNHNHNHNNNKRELRRLSNLGTKSRKWLLNWKKSMPWSDNNNDDDHDSEQDDKDKNEESDSEGESDNSHSHSHSHSDRRCGGRKGRTLDVDKQADRTISDSISHSLSQKQSSLSDWLIKTKSSIQLKTSEAKSSFEKKKKNRRKPPSKKTRLKKAFFFTFTAFTLFFLSCHTFAFCSNWYPCAAMAKLESSIATLAKRVLPPPVAQTLEDVVEMARQGITRQYLSAAGKAEWIGGYTTRGGWMSSSDVFNRGLDFMDRGVNAKHPLIMIPGIVSTGLESWSVHPCAQKYLRKRLWGTMNMLRSMVLDRECWLVHMSLDEKTGLDPPGVKVRAAQGLEAADYLLPGYWVWGQVISQAAAVGYDNNNLQLAAYDWRLSHPLLETRDRYFTKLKQDIERSVEREGRKAVVAAHSMGSNVFLYFFKWVESDLGGNGGPSWVNDHIDTFVNIGGPLLGLPKTLASVLSGEMRDTAELGTWTATLLENFLSKDERAALFRSWGGLASMLPKGGNAVSCLGDYKLYNIQSNAMFFPKVWGDESSAPDDDPEVKAAHDNKYTHGPIMRMRVTEKNNVTGVMETNLRNLTVNQALELVVSSTPTWFSDLLNRHYSFSSTVDESKLKDADQDPRKWSNPLESRLPYAPDMKIVCMYGVGKPAERNYHYAGEPISSDNDTSPEGSFFEFLQKTRGFVNKGHTRTKHNEEEHAPDAKRNDERSRSPDPEGRIKKFSPEAHVTMSIDRSQNKPEQILSSGVQKSEGDGTVPLLSLSYMCTSGWKKKLYNPGGSPVVLREYEDRSVPRFTDIRGGDDSGDHVDMLGNVQVLEDLLRIASGNGADVTERVVSEAYEMAKKVDERLFANR